MAVCLHDQSETVFYSGSDNLMEAAVLEERPLFHVHVHLFASPYGADANVKALRRESDARLRTSGVCLVEPATNGWLDSTALFCALYLRYKGKV
jgi:hypothetical protein